MAPTMRGMVALFFPIFGRTIFSRAAFFLYLSEVRLQIPVRLCFC
jgi:hypothetical protein